MPQSFAQISDPHLSTLNGVDFRDLLNKRALGYLSWRRKRRLQHRREILDALQADLAQTDPQLLLITGDLTHIGLPMEFQQAREWLLQLGPAADIALVPGNHDSCVAAPWSDTYALWAEYMASDPAVSGQPPPGASFPSLRRRGNIAFIGLSTACPTAPLMATGHIDPEQLKALPAVLDQTYRERLFRVVYLHHSPLPGIDKWRKRLRNAPAVAGILAAHGAELVLHGHDHRSLHVKIETCHGDALVLALPSASALGLRGEESSAYNTYNLEARSDGWLLEVRRRSYDVRRQLFRPGDSFSLYIKRPAAPPVAKAHGSIKPRPPTGIPTLEPYSRKDANASSLVD